MHDRLKSRGFDINLLAIRMFFLMNTLYLIRIVPSSVKGLSKYVFIGIAILALISRNGKIKLGFTDFIFLMYGLVSIVSILLSPYFDSSMFLALAQFLLMMFCLSIISVQELKAEVKRYLRFFEIFVCVSIVFSLFLYLFGSVTRSGGNRINYIGTPLFGQLMLGMKGNYGYASVFTNPNPFGTNIIIVFCWRLTRFNFKKPIQWLEFPLLIVGLFLANSRGAFYSLFIVAFVFLFISLKHNIIRIVIVIAFTISVFIGFLFFFSQIKSFIMGVDLNGREITWGLLIEAIKQSPLLGIGYSASTKVILQGVVEGAYSSYLSILSDAGAVGFLLFVVLIIYVFRSIIAELENDRNYARFCLLFTIMMLVVGVTENMFFNTTAKYLMWMLCISALFCGDGKEITDEP